MKEDEVVHGQTDTALLIRLIENVASLTSKFDSFEKVRSEDNMELKDAIKKVDDKVDKLDAKFESRHESYSQDFAKMRDSITELQKAPLKEKATKWESVTKLVVETIIAACLVVLLAKIGLQ